MQALIQKLCIWVLSLIPFAYISYVSMKDLGPKTDMYTFAALGISMAALALSMYIAERWCKRWDYWDAQERQYEQQVQQERERKAKWQQASERMRSQNNQAVGS